MSKSGTLYEHYKGGTYIVFGVARCSESKEELVVYRSISGGNVWVRPRAMFEECVTVDGVQIPRFKELPLSKREMAQRVWKSFSGWLNV